MYQRNIVTDTIWAPDLTDTAGPKYLALAQAIRQAVRTGTLERGARLPPVRDLAWHLGITPGTVARAYQIGTAEGILDAAVGRGTFVASGAPRMGPQQPLFVEPDPCLVDLRTPKLPDVGQVAFLRRALHAMADDLDGSILDYPSQTSELPLRETLAQWLSNRVMGRVAAGDLALTNGGQAAVNLVMSCCLRGDRPVVLAEDLTYAGFRLAARLHRAEVQGLAMDDQGILPEALEVACRRGGAQILCLMPEAQNPTTARMPVERRQTIAEIARRHDLQVIEDDSYSVTQSVLPSLRNFAPERTWNVGSLSKWFSAGLRFGFVLCPEGMGEAGRLTAQHMHYAVARPVTALVHRLVTSGEADTLKGRIEAEFAERLEATVNALGAFDLSWQPGLPYVWLRLPKGWRASTFVARAEAAGVRVRSADEFALSDARAPNAIRIAISAPATQEALASGVQTLQRLLANPPTEIAV